MPATLGSSGGLYERLRRSPSASSVRQSLPVLFFGDLLNARVVTVGLNPSDQEYVDRYKVELEVPHRRFETLTSLCAIDRPSLTDEQCDRAIQTMREYYQPGKPVYRWFRSLDRVTTAMGFRYERGEVAHLDLVQEATNPTWSKLPRTEREKLKKQDLPFLRWLLEEFAVDTVICNGRTVFDEVCKLVGGQAAKKGNLKRLTWYMCNASVGSRSIHLVGWNIPLAHATGLGAVGERELGQLFLSHLEMESDS